MTTAGWIKSFILGLLAGLLLLAGFNFCLDPFGVFGDRITGWHGYNMSNNPRLGKIGYLERYGDRYDSFIIGSSKSSSISPAQLNAYYPGASFYNMMAYGADLAHMEKTLYYLADRFTVRNIVLHIGISELLIYDNDTNDVKEELHGKVSGRNPFLFYGKYLLLNPSYGLEKLGHLMQRRDTPLPSEVDVFLPETGVYNKVLRDQENIVNINEYVAEISGGMFTQLAEVKNESVDPALCVESIRRMEMFCRERGITFLVVSGPNYDGELIGYDLDIVKRYWGMLAEALPFWNFSGYSSYSGDPRYFYDPIHYRNDMGEMMMARIFEDDSYVLHEDFGFYMAVDNAEVLSEKHLTPNPDLTGHIESGEDAVPMPILMYHDIVPDGEEEDFLRVSESKFRNDLSALQQAGYTAISFSELTAYVHGDGALPEKPVIITFDDGYLGNYLYAWPILEEFGMKATIHMIGWSTGRDRRDNGDPINPHFSWEQAFEMQQSGLIDLQSHSYDFHELYGEDEGRDGLLPMQGEAHRDYVKALTEDSDQMVQEMEKWLDRRPFVFSYPYGYATLWSEQALQDLGYEVTLLTGYKVSSIRKGSPYSLYGLYRINADYALPSDQLVQSLEVEYN